MSNRVRATQTIRNWNDHFPPGTEVLFEGRTVKTWSWAALGFRDEPVVFLDCEVQEPVPLIRLDVPGWERTRKKG